MIITVSLLWLGWDFFSGVSFFTIYTAPQDGGGNSHFGQISAIKKWLLNRLICHETGTGVIEAEWFVIQIVG